MPDSVPPLFERKYICIICGDPLDDPFFLGACVMCRDCLHRPPWRNSREGKHDARAARPKATIGDWQSRLCKLRGVLAVLEAEKAELQQADDQYKKKRIDAVPSFWFQLFGFGHDSTIKEFEKRLNDLHMEVGWYKEAVGRLESVISDTRKLARSHLKLQLIRNAAETTKRAQAEEQKQFRDLSINNLQDSYDRHQFSIVSTDYRRGNAIDNYFRKQLSERVLAAFNNICALCGAIQDLTFDHYGLPKNEGGNFALVMADKSSIRVNIIVLCRSCNAAKGQRRYDMLFNVEQRNHIVSCHQSLLDYLLHDERFLSFVKNRKRDEVALR